MATRNNDAMPTSYGRAKYLKRSQPPEPRPLETASHSAARPHTTGCLVPHAGMIPAAD